MGKKKKKSKHALQKDSLPAPTLAAQNATLLPVSDTDPNGSYTGRPRDTDAIPVQDADDL